MKTILVVDVMPIFRDPIAASLRLAGYQTECASNGREALRVYRAQRPALILLDIAMPEMDGLSFLEALRSQWPGDRVPVILLSALSERKHVLLAAKLGVRDYLLKSRFSLQDLLERVRRYLPSGESPAGEPESDRKLAPAGPDAPGQSSGTASQATTPSPELAVSPVETRVDADRKRVEIPRLLTREACVARAEGAMEAKTLSGVVAQVVSLAASPRGDVSQLATLIARDPMLSARVLQAANSAAYLSNRGVVATIPDAVRHIGCAQVRNIAAALGIFDVMPESDRRGFNLIRCWQHSFAVAILCERLLAGADASESGPAYVIGLCHDLGEILFHTHFASEYRQVMEIQFRTGRRLSELERAMMGMTHGELVTTILRRIGLPQAIRDPIEAFHRSSSGGRYDPGAPKLTRVLRLANLYANGALLATSGASGVSPVTRGECRALVSADDLPQPDSVDLRAEIYSLTGMLARLSSEDEAKLMAPQYPSREARIWLAREKVFSSFDPIAAALESLADVQVRERLPTGGELDEFQGLVVIARRDTTAGFSGLEIRQAAGSAPVLWLTDPEQIAGGGPSAEQPIAQQTWPVSLEKLAAFVESAAVR